MCEYYKLVGDLPRKSTTIPTEATAMYETAELHQANSSFQKKITQTQTYPFAIIVSFCSVTHAIKQKQQNHHKHKY